MGTIDRRLFMVGSVGDDGIHYGAVKIVEKVWGVEYWLVNSPVYCSKILQIKSGFTSSRHRHKIKDETFVVLSGACNVEVGEQEFRLGPGGSIKIPPNCLHRFYLKRSDRECRVLEVSTHHDEADVFRESESGRVNIGFGRRGANAF
jgi:mannose-6-phosphate isomerase-like protein (cupin superfamily)